MSAITEDMIYDMIIRVVDECPPLPIKTELERYGLQRYRRDVKTLTLGLPRQKGHTRAAIRVLKRYPQSLLVTNPGTVFRLRKSNYELIEQIISRFDTNIRGNTKLDELRTMAILSGGMDCLIIDGTTLDQTQLDSLYDVFLPKIVVILGDARIE